MIKHKCLLIGATRCKRRNLPVILQLALLDDVTHLMCVKPCLAQRAIVVPLKPRLDALRVKVVPLVAGQWRDLIIVLELLQTDCALLMVVETRVAKNLR